MTPSQEAVVYIDMLHRVIGSLFMMYYQCSRTLFWMYLERLTELYAKLFRLEKIKNEPTLL